MRPADFTDSKPEFRIEEFFAGQTRAYGMVLNRGGKPLRYFRVDIRGEWEGEEFLLHEDFVFQDGERSQRTWRIRKIDEHTYEGRAGDVVGTATGIRSGNALHWRYDLLLPVKGREWQIHFDDWMFLHPDGVLINRAEMRKFGLRVGEIQLFFERVPEGS